MEANDSLVSSLVGEFEGMDKVLATLDFEKQVDLISDTLRSQEKCFLRRFKEWVTGKE